MDIDFQKIFSDYFEQISTLIPNILTGILVLIIAFALTNLILKLARRIVNKQLDDIDRGKFKSIFSFLKVLVHYKDSSHFRFWTFFMLKF